MKTIALTPEQAQTGEKIFRDTMTPENRIVRDDIYTPFIMGMQAAGFSVFLNHCDCNVLSECPDCKRPYRTLVERDTRKAWACPYCNSLSDASPR